MKKKLLTFILMITAMFTGVVGLTACEKEPTPPQGPAQSSNDMGNTGNESTHTHTYTSTTKQPTCAEKGLTTYTCACGDSYTEEIPATGEHTWDDGVETTAPTCAKEGVTTYTCTVCQTETKTEPIDKLPHEHSVEWSSNATHHWYECECGDKKDEAEHTAGAPATATTPQTCTVCGYILQAETGILFNTLDVDGTKVYGKVSNDTTEFSFINEVTVKGNATYVVDNDKNCDSPIYSKTVDLAIGDNTFYVLEMIGNDIKLFTVTIRRRPMYEVTFNTNGGTSVEKQVIEEDFLATEPETTRAGYTFSGWDYDFATPITDNTEITATWSANTDTKYTVNYYWQNIEDDGYTLHETVELTGETDTTAKAEIKEYTHFTYNASKSTITGNINPTGSRVLSVYYTRDSYKIIANNNNKKAGTATSVSGTYKFDKEITLMATTNAGYTWLGWYDGETLACETEEFTFKAEKDVTYTATWSVNTDTKYTVNYYLQNLDDDEYTLRETVELTGETDTTATAEIKEYAHFTYNASKSTITGNINPTGSRVLSVYYTRDSYKIVANNNNAKAGTATSVSGTYKFDKEFTLTATTNAGYTWLGWYDGETLACETEEFTFKAEKDVTYTATWTANTDTKYTVNYYLQNLDDSNYTLHETVELKGETDTTAKAEIKEYTHFTYYSYKSTVSGNINGDGILVLSVYYTRDSYSIIANNNNAKAGTATSVSGTYKFDKEFTLTATTNAGYTWLGWYDGETLACETEEFTFKAEKDVTYTATWSANTDTKYTVNYYLQNLDDDEYTLHETVELSGETDTTASATIQEYTHFTFNASASTTSGNIDGNGTLVLSVYYTRNAYTLSINRASAGSITNAGTYKYGVEEFVTTATPDLGCEFVGWYSGETLLSTYLTYTFTVTQNVTAKLEVKAEMSKFNFTSTATTCSITGVKDKTVTKIIVPDYVTSISESAFQYCRRLTSVVIGDSVKSIGSSAFSYCENLTSIVIPDSVTSIGYSAFECCRSLKSVVIGDNVKSIGDKAFYYCENLTSIEIPDSVTSIGEWAFWNCSSLTSVIIGNSVTSIGYRVFGDCKSLTSITIPDSVTSIGEDAFYWCDSLKSVEIPDSVTSIGDNVFYNCYSLTSIEIPDSVTSIGEYAFWNCSSLTSVVIGDSVTSIGKGAFGGCSGLTEITLPFVGAKAGKTANDTYQYPFGYIFGTSEYTGGTATEQYYYGSSTSSTTSSTYYIPTSLKKVTITGGNILYGAFHNCWRLTSIEIPDSVTSISDRAFNSCSRLTSIEIPDGVKSIGEYAFEDCSSLTSIEIPDGVTSIGYYAFEGCRCLTKITLPFVGETKYGTSNTHFGYIFGASSYSDNNSYVPTSLKKVTITGGKIPYGAFSGCINLTSVVIPDSVTSIGSSAFKTCSRLTSIEIPDSVTSIGSSAFDACWSLTSIEIPDSVTSIGSYAFRDCRSLTSVEFGNAVTSIGSYAFWDCSSLTSVVIPDSVTSIGNYAFEDCSSLTSVVIGDSVTSIGSYVFRGCSSLTSVVIGNSVTSIDYYAFNGCSSLKSVTFKDTSTWYRTTNSSDWNNKTGGTSTNVTNSSTNATYFKPTYINYYWYKL